MRVSARADREVLGVLSHLWSEITELLRLGMPRGVQAALRGVSAPGQMAQGTAVTTRCRCPQCAPPRHLRW